MIPAARRFVLLALGLTGLLAGGLVLLNYLVDPYDLFGLNRLGVYISADREYKATEVRRYPHNALVVGNSRMGVVPADRLEGFRFFNGAVAGGSTEETFYFLSHFAQKQELVIIGLDLGACDPLRTKGDIFAPPGCLAILNNLFNLQTVEYSLRTILDHRAGIPNPMYPDGTFDMARWVKSADLENPTLRDYQLQQMKRALDYFTGAPKEQMSFLARTAECLRQRGIACVVVVNPLHEEVAKCFEAPPLRAAAQAWLANLKSMFPNVVDLSFSRYGAAEGFFRSDPAHFKPEVAVRMMNTEVIPVALAALRRHPSRETTNSAPPQALLRSPAAGQ
jgi:hypothetical protein